MIHIYVDGSSKGKYGYVAMSCDGMETIDSQVFTLEGLTSNQAEYQAVLQALKAFPDQNVQIISDNRLVVDQLNNPWSINNCFLRSRAMDIWELCKNRRVEFVWVSRKQNKAGKLLG